MSSNQLIFLHGFLGSPDDFNQVIDLLSPSLKKNYEIIAPELKELKNILRHEKVVLLGYSMGGRVALHEIMKRNLRVKGLILESSSPGIEDKKERHSRYESDKKLLQPVLKGEKSFSDFLHNWYDQNLFQGIKEHKNFSDFAASKLSLDIKTQEELLIEFSSGHLPSYWQELPYINFPVLYLSGEKDLKYKEIGIRAMSQNKVHLKLKIIPNCSHNIHFENPQAFALEVESFIRQL